MFGNQIQQKVMTPQEAIEIIENFSEAETLRLNKFEHFALQSAINTLKNQFLEKEESDESKNRRSEAGK
jgi:hypothetical protein